MGAQSEGTDRVEWQLVERYATGNVTPAEQELVERWLAADPSLAGVVDLLREALPPLPSDGGLDLPARKAAVWARLERDLEAG